MQQLAYFDNAATTYPKPESIYQQMDLFYRENGANVGRGEYEKSASASILVCETRTMLQKIFGATNKEVVFFPSATIALNTAIQGIPNLEHKTVYISPFEHNASTRVLHYLEKNYHIKTRQLSVDQSTLDYDFETIKQQFMQEPPYAIILSHVSNVCGAICPIEKICREGKRYSAFTIIDTCQSAGIVPIDGSQEIYDALVFAGHKTLYGPLGIAGFLLSKNFRPLPLLFGGTGADSVNQAPSEILPQRYEVGSMNIQALAGLHAALKWLLETGLSKIVKIDQENKIKMLDILSTFSNIQIINPKESTSVVSCVFEGYSSDNIGQVLNDRHVAVRTGLHCSPYAHKFLKTFPSGTVRFSPGYFTSSEEYQILTNALEYIYINS